MAFKVKNYNYFWGRTKLSIFLISKSNLAVLHKMKNFIIIRKKHFFSTSVVLQ